MRKNGEAISGPRERNYILWSNFETKLRDHDALAQSLAVLSPADTEATYDWLDPGPSEGYKRWARDFVVANLREIDGRRAEALAQYVSLRTQIRGSGSVPIPYVEQAIKRLSAHK